MYRKFLAALFGDVQDKYILLWFYDGDKLKESFWFASTKAAADFLDKVKERHVNAYMGVGLSPKDYGKNQRCLKKDVAGIGGLWLDIDYKCAEHKKPNLPGSKDEAYKLFDDRFMPSAVVNSGHGLQAWWIFREPWLFDSVTERADAEQLSRRFNYYFKAEAAKHGWDVDSTFNLDRVMRVPGTTNYKSKPVPVELISLNDVRYNPSEFESWLPELSKEQQSLSEPSKLKFELAADLEPPFDKFNTASEIEPNFGLSWEKKRKDFQDQSASSYDLSLARFAYMFGWSDQEVVSLLVAFRRKHKEDLKLRMDYYERTLTIAKKNIKKQQASELIDNYVDAQDLDAAGTIDPNQKESILQALSARFDVRLVQIIKFVADPPIYKLKTVRGDVTLGEVDNLIGQAKLRTHIAAVTGKFMPRFKADKWDNVAQALLDCCYDVEIGDEATEIGEVKSWLMQYLDAKQPMDSEDINDAAMHQLPVKYHGSVAIFGSDFRKWLRTTQQEKVTSKRMGLLLRGIGCMPEKMTAEIDGKITTRSIWILKGE